jgi:hypothetical protein
MYSLYSTHKRNSKTGVPERSLLAEKMKRNRDKKLLKVMLIFGNNNIQYSSREASP